LITLKNTPSRSVTPASGVCQPPLTPGLYSPSPSQYRGTSPARGRVVFNQVPQQQHQQQHCQQQRANSITPSFRTPVRITDQSANDSGLDSLGPTPNPHQRSDISPAERGLAGTRSTSPPIITEERAMRHDTAKPEPTREHLGPQHITSLLPILPITTIPGKQTVYDQRPINTTFPWHTLLPEFPAQLKQSPNSSFERPAQSSNGNGSNGDGGDYGHYQQQDQNGQAPPSQQQQPPPPPTNGQNGVYEKVSSHQQQQQQTSQMYHLTPVMSKQQPIKTKGTTTTTTTAVKTEKHERETKKKEHIRRPMNAFMLFSKELRGAVHKRHPKKDNRSVSKLLGEMWNGLKDGEKAKFQQQAADLKEQHYKDHPDWKWSNKDRRRSAKVSQKLFDDKKDYEEQRVYQQATPTTAKVMHLVDSYYPQNGQQQQHHLQPPPPPVAATTTTAQLPQHQQHHQHQVTTATTTHQLVSVPKGVKRPRTICPKPKSQEIELQQFYCDEQTMTLVEKEPDFEDQDGNQYALTVDNQLIQIQCVVSNPIAAMQQQQQKTTENEIWSTSSSRSCSSTSSSGICSTASSDHESNQKSIKTKLRIDNSPRRQVRAEEQDRATKHVLKRKSDSAFSTPAKSRKPALESGVESGAESGMVV
jgi:hypothetical protein